MSNDPITAALRDIAMTLDACADDVPYELSAKDNLYFRMVDLAKQARALAKEVQETK